MAGGTPRSAKNAQVRIGATAFFGAKWDVKITADDLDTTNFEGGGFGDVETGCLVAEVSLEGYLDGTQNPFDSPPNLSAGQTLSTVVKLYLTGTTSPFWLFPVIKVLENSSTAEVRGLLQFTARFKNKGTFTAPTGSF